jgi:holo-[acyl-carrier protein] synthase
MILGVGTDIVGLERMRGIVEQHEGRFLRRVFTEREISYCQSRKRPHQHFAGRFAAKEAVFKALGTGWRGRMRWKDIRVDADDLGRPCVELEGAVLQRAKKMGVQTIHLSLSHCQCHAVAVAVAEGEM